MNFSTLIEDNNKLQDFSHYAFAYESLDPREITKPTKELEYNVKCYLTNPDVLNEYSNYTDIEQWTINIDKTPAKPSKGSSRVRKTTTAQGVSQYTLTDKLLVQATDENGFSSRAEHTVEITKEHFDIRKLLTETGQIKRRYSKVCDIEGPFKGYTWEIDIFYNKDGTLSNTCMIEMEVNEKIDQDMPIPEGFTLMTQEQIAIARQSIFSITH